MQAMYGKGSLYAPPQQLVKCEPTEAVKAPFGCAPCLKNKNMVAISHKYARGNLRATSTPFQMHVASSRTCVPSTDKAPQKP